APRAGSTYATAQLDVPKSMPTRKSATIPALLFHAHIQFELPPARPLFLQATQFQGSDFGYGSLKIHWHELSGRAGIAGQCGFNRSDLFQLICSGGVVDHVSDAVFAAYRRS